MEQATGRGVDDLDRGAGSAGVRYRVRWGPAVLFWAVAILCAVLVDVGTDGSGDTALLLLAGAGVISAAVGVVRLFRTDPFHRPWEYLPRADRRSVAGVINRPGRALELPRRLWPAAASAIEHQVRTSTAYAPWALPGFAGLILSVLVRMTDEFSWLDLLTLVGWLGMTAGFVLSLVSGLRGRAVLDRLTAPDPHAPDRSDVA